MKDNKKENNKEVKAKKILRIEPAAYYSAYSYDRSFSCYN